jgi:adenine-specific DNA-methyltransferase
LNYIGSKKTLLPFIYKSIIEDINIDNSVFCDLFAGTGIVGRFFKNKTKKVISNDLEDFSYSLLKNYIENTEVFDIPFIPSPKEGFIYNNYCMGSGSERMYFSDYNGKLIDGIRIEIEKYKYNEKLYFFLICSLLESADKVANTASVYGAFLKNLKLTAQKEMELVPYYPDEGPSGEVYNEDVNNLIRKIKGDILYLDPPYNTRQYSANYHLLNTISNYKEFVPAGKTGLPQYNKSLYSRKREAKDVFFDLIQNADFEHIYISYNNEGIIPFDDFQDILSKFGNYKLYLYDGYRRFKADSNRDYISDNTVEFLHYLRKT